jgi:predicted esterase
MNTEDLITHGTPLIAAQTAVILVHGRGASAHSLLPLANALSSPGVAFLLPQAPGGVWYPYPFMAPIEQNEPQLTAALASIGSALAKTKLAGLEPARVVLAGFSQGACLALEYAARNAQRYQGLAGLSGGLIGPPGTPRTYPGSLDDTPIFLGCGVPDTHIPKERVLESAQVLEQLGGQVSTRLYPGMGHSVNNEEIEFVRAIIGG